MFVVRSLQLGFFKRKYQQLQRGDDGAEAEGLQDNAGQQWDPDGFPRPVQDYLISDQLELKL